MADQNSNQVPAGVTFGDAVQQDTPVENLQPTSASASGSAAGAPSGAPAGVTFGAPVQQDTPASDLQKPVYPRYQPAAKKQGYLEGLYESTPLKGIVDSMKQKAADEEQYSKAMTDALKRRDWGTMFELAWKKLKTEAPEAIAQNPGIGPLVSSGEHLYEAGKAAVHGDAGSAVENTTEAVPILGPMAEAPGKALGTAIGENIDKPSNERDYGKIAGAATGAVLTAASPLAGEAVGAVRNLASGSEAAEGAAAEAAEGAEQAATPVEAAVSKSVKKVGLPEGKPASEAPTSEDIQPNLQQGIRDTMAKVAEENEVPAPKAASVRDVVKEVADNVYAKSKAAYRQLDEASGGRWQRFDDQIRNIQKQMNEVNGIDEEKYANLETRRNEIETQQAQLIEDLKEAGKIDPQIADKAAADYKRAQALYDYDSQLKMATEGSRPGIGSGKNPEIVDPNKFFARTNKLYDTGRLQQAVGDESAIDLLNHADAAQVASRVIKEFVPSSPTGQQALAELIRNRTTGAPKSMPFVKGSKGVTDWDGALKDFEKLDAKEQATRFGPDVQRVRNYLSRKAWQQSAMRLVKRYGPYVVGAGYLGREITHAIE